MIRMLSTVAVTSQRLPLRHARFYLVNAGRDAADQGDALMCCTVVADRSE